MDVELPRSVWARSARPSRGNLIRWLLALTFVLSGLAAPSIVLKLALVVAGVGAFLAVPALADRRLAATEHEILGATKTTAATLLGGLDARQIVALFAPHGWVALQKARLHLVAGDGRAAARALSECGRMCNEPNHPALLSGRARAYTLAGDRSDARSVLAELAKRDAMTPRDHLDLGAVLLGDSGRAAQAREAIERAARDLGDHPQTKAALAIVRARQDAVGEAKQLLDDAETADGVDGDAIAQELIRRARKVLRPALKDGAKKSKSKGAKAGSEGSEGSEAPGTAAASGKRDKRRERRERRKAGKSAKGGAQSPTARPEVVEAKAAPKPAVAEPTPVVAAPKPAVAERKPVVAEPKPVVAATPKPVVTAPKPVVTAPKPVVAAPKPAISAGPSTPPKPPATPTPKAAEAEKPGGLFNQLGSRVSMFKPPPIPPRIGPPPKIGPPPRVGAPPSMASTPKTVAPPVSPDDAWDDMLDSGDHPPAPLDKK